MADIILTFLYENLALFMQESHKDGRISTDFPFPAILHKHPCFCRISSDVLKLLHSVTFHWFLQTLEIKTTCANLRENGESAQ